MNLDMITETKNTKAFYNNEIPSGWEVKRFDEFAPLQRGFDLPVNDIIEGEFPVVFSNGILKHHNDYKAKSPGVVTGRSGTIGNVTFVEKDYWPHNTSLWVTDFKGNKPLFVYYYIIFIGLERFGSGSGVPTLNRNDVHSFKVVIPPLPEQKAIAQVLSTADAAIHTTEKLIAQKELRKKWLMQQLLTGKMRLKGFGGEWKEMHIRDVAKEVSIRNKSDKQLTVLSCTKYDGLVPSLEYFGRKIFADDVSTYKIVPKNHFAYATNHIEEGSIGYQEILDEALISPMYTVFKTDKTVNDNFFYKLLKSHPLVYQYQNRMEGSIDRRGGLRWDGFSIIKFKLPSIEEQTAIAQVLQAADKEISLLKAKAEKLREQKKGLMQVLLTGKKRLNYDSSDINDGHDSNTVKLKSK